MIALTALVLLFVACMAVAHFRNLAADWKRRAQETAGGMSVLTDRAYRRGIEDERQRVSSPIDEREIQAYERGLKEGHNAAYQTWVKVLERKGVKLSQTGETMVHAPAFVEGETVRLMGVRITEHGKDLAS